VIPTVFSFYWAQRGSYATQPDFVSTTTGWAILQDAYDHTSLITTRDGGQTWTILNPQIK
jgi:hypothetical protein